MQLLQATYELTSSYPRREMFGITAQMRRAALSIPANIAEGYGRNTTPDFIRFLWIANGSLRELQTYFDASVLLGFSSEAGVSRGQDLSDESARMLMAFREGLQRNPRRHP